MKPKQALIAALHAWGDQWWKEKRATFFSLNTNSNASSSVHLVQLEYEEHVSSQTKSRKWKKAKTLS
ncbi:hypothetical protein AHAS_Ahas19G0288900 [Arachis hypogaea]